MKDNMSTEAKIHNPTLSLCMIVKDEEKFLPICLESVKDHVDEIIIVDTGSTDRTVEIATKYNAKIYHHPWENSFSKARNYSLKYATCDWIMWIDADEEVNKNDAHKLKDVIRDDEVDVICLPMFNRPIGGKAVSTFIAEKIFRNHIGIHFEGIVHNSLKHSGLTKKENIRLNHYGYNQGDKQMEKKFKRTSSLLKLQIKDDPDNPTPHHYLAISCLERHRYEECIKEAMEAIRLFELKNSNSQFSLLSYYTACVAFYQTNDLDNAEKYALKATKLFPDYLDAHCILTSIYFLRKEYDKCTEETNKYLELLESLNSDPSKAMFIPYNTLQDAWLAHTRMAINYFEQNNDGEGMQSLKSAIESADSVYKPYLTIGKHFTEHDNLKMAERFLCDGLKHDPENKEMKYYLADTFEKSDSSDKALKLFRSILEDNEDETLAEYRIGLLHAKHNRFEEAIKSFKSVTNKEPEHFDALLNMAITYEKTGKIEQSRNIYNTLITMDPDNYEVLLRLGSLYLLENDNNRAKECFLELVNSEKYLTEAHLGLSKVYLSINDPESCIRSCDELLRHLKLPRNLIINSLNDLGNIYTLIGTTLIEHQNETLSGFAFEIATILDPDANNAIQPVATNPL